MPAGTATLDFGAFPGSSHTTVAVIGQAGILSGSRVEAWVQPSATADHSADEHIVESLVVAADASSIVAGTGFTIHGLNFSNLGDTLLYGLWSVAWAWA